MIWEFNLSGLQPFGDNSSMPKGNGWKEEKSAFRNQAPEESISYFLELERIYHAEEDLLQRQLLVDNVFKEITQVEKIGLDTTCTKILELFAPQAKLESVLSLLKQINQGDVLYLLSSKYACTEQKFPSELSHALDFRWL